MKAILSFSAFLMLSYSCNNSAPKNDSASTNDTGKTSDTSVLIMNDTVPVTSVTKTSTPPPPPPATRFLEMQAVEITDEDMDPPPIMDANVNPYYQSNGDPIVVDATGPVPEIDSRIFLNVDQKPEMPLLKEFLFDNMIYPESALSAGIQGVSTIGFVVNENGNLENIKVVKSSGNNDLDKEAMRVMKKTNGKWKPGRINGNAVKTQMSVPITFQLDE